MNRLRGFSVIEVLVVLSLLVLLTAIVLISLAKLNSSQVLDKSASLVAAVIDDARSLTLSAKNDSQYGVYFEAGDITIFKGATYSSGDPENIVTPLDSRVALRNITLTGGGSSIVFNRLTGETDNSGTLEVYLTASSNTFKTITVTATGVVDITNP